METWQGYSAESRDLIGRLLIKNPENRISLLEVLNHKWFKSVKDKIEKKLLLKARSPVREP